MRLGSERVGARGLMVLGAAGVLGLGLAVHGYGRGTVVSTAASGIGAPPGLAGAAPRSGPSAPKRPLANPNGSAVPDPSKGTSSRPAGTSTTPASPTTTALAQKLGPLLSSTQYGQYAYQVYPGPVSSQAQLAEAGFDVRITPGASRFTVRASAAGGSGSPQTSTYPNGDRVYFVEAAFGDDSGGSDYSYSDDGVVVTDAQGRIVE
ncbi:MAG: hypothetical protein M0020_02870 [Actinomycetota bacterium]|nr:hypothetical protein [Actinomycetota bacterium]